MDLKSNKILLVKNSFRHIAAPWGWTNSVIGVLGDIFKPAFDCAPLLFGGFTAMFIASFILFRKKSKAEGLEKAFNSTLGGMVTFFALSSVVWFLLTFVFAVTPKDGIAASVVPGIEQFQKDILKIGKDVTDIKGSVGRIEEKIDQLSKGGTVISNPKTPEEFYVNARFYEVKGNTGEALKSYEKFLDLAPNYVDAHLAYQTLLNNTQGIEATRQIYAGLQAKHPDSPVINLMTFHLLADRGEKIGKLTGLVAQNPQFGPAAFELAEEYIKPGPGNITIDDMKNAKEAFEKFKAADEKGGVKPYYIDKKALDAVYAQRDEYDKRVKSFYGNMMSKPMDLRVEVLPQLVCITISPSEIHIQKILYSIDDPNPTIDTGPSPYLKDPTTGGPTPSMQVTGKVAEGKHVLYAKYVDANGKESAVVSKPFEVTPILAHSLPKPGDLGSTALNFTINFQSIDGKNYEYFYSLDKPDPDTKVKGDELALQGLPAGAHELFYYGTSAGKKTETYSLKLSQ